MMRKLNLPTIIILSVFITGSVMGRISSTAFLISKLAGVGLGVYFLFFTKLRSIMYNSIFNWFILFMLWSLISGYYVSLSFSTTVNALITPLQLLIFMILLYGIFRRIGQFDELAWSFVISVSFIMFGSFVGIQLGGQTGYRFQGLTYNANVFGLYINYMLIALAYLMYSQRRSVFLKVLFLFLAIVGVYMVLRSGSRSALALTLAVGGVFINSRFKLNVTSLMLLMVALLGLYVVYDYLSSLILDTATIQRITNEQYLSKGANIRFENISVAYKVFLQHPIAGVGLDNFKYLNPLGFAAHNYLLEILAGTGTIGVLILTILYGNYFVQFRSFSRVIFNSDQRYYIIQFMLISVLWSLTFHLYNAIEHWIFLSASLGVMQALKQNGPVSDDTLNGPLAES